MRHARNDMQQDFKHDQISLSLKLLTTITRNNMSQRLGNWCPTGTLNSERDRCPSPQPYTQGLQNIRSIEPDRLHAIQIKPTTNRPYNIRLMSRALH